MLTSCRLCPRDCGVNRLAGETGFCGAGATVRVALVSLHRWEEPCLSGTNGSGTVFFSYCSLRCVFCQNHVISQAGYGKDITVARLGEIFLEQEARGAHNINLVNPTHYVPQIAAAVQLARAGGLSLPIVYNSSGYENPETVAALKETVDVFLPDLKYFNSRYARKYSAAPDYFFHASRAIRAMVEQTGPPEFGADGLMRRGVVIRVLLLPGLLDDAKRIVRHIYTACGDLVYVSLMSQYTPVFQAENYPEINRTVDPGEYRSLVEYAAGLGLRRGFVQEGGAAAESFIPSFDLRGV